jgi:peptidyl-prolyl cis-trans isomerase A (cyclophilin A)
MVFWPERRKPMKARFGLLLVLSVVALGNFAPPGAAGEMQASRPQVLIETSLGAITVELDPQLAPITSENFLRYVRSGFYTGTVFHRVIDGFMIQGGGYTKDGNQKTPLYPPIALESRGGLKNQRGTLAMARSADPNSATCQFFINVVDNPSLDYSEKTNPAGYAVFGRVVKGMDVVDRIRAVKVVENPTDIQDGIPAPSKPATAVVINAMRILDGAPAGDEKGTEN